MVIEKLFFSQVANCAVVGSLYKCIGMSMGAIATKIPMKNENSNLENIFKISAGIFAGMGTFLYGSVLYSVSKEFNIKWFSDHNIVCWGTLCSASIGEGLAQSEKFGEMKVVQALYVAAEIISLAAIIGVFASINLATTDADKQLCKGAGIWQTPYLIAKSYQGLPKKNQAAPPPADDRPPVGGAYGVDLGLNHSYLTQMALDQEKEVHYLGREATVEKVMSILASEAKINNVLLQGPAGVGKTEMVRFIAQEIREGRIRGFEDYKVFSTTGAELIADATLVGQTQGRILKLFQFLESQSKVILFVDEIHDLIGAGRGRNGTMDAAGMFLTYLHKKHIRVIGATTPEAAKRLDENIPFRKRFVPIAMPEMTLELRKEILEELIGKKRAEGLAFPGGFAVKIRDFNHSHAKRSPRDDDALFWLIVSTMKRSEVGANEAFDLIVEDGALTRNAVSMPKFVTELTAETKDVEYLGREDLVDDVLDILYSDGDANNVVLEGEAGTGKTELARFLAYQIRNKELEGFEGFKVYMTTASDMVAGGKYIGDPEQRVADLFKFLEGEGDVILFIDEIHHVIGAGQGMNKTADLSGMLLTKLLNSKIRVIGATTPKEAEALGRNQPFKSRFRGLKMPPMAKELRLQIVNRCLARHEGLVFPEGFADRIIEHNGEVSIRSDKQAIGTIASRMKRKHVDVPAAFQAVTGEPFVVGGNLD